MKTGDLIKVDGFLYTEAGELITRCLGLAIIIDGCAKHPYEYLEVVYKNQKGFIMRAHCESINEDR